MHGDGPGIQDALLLQVDLLQEVQHAAGVGGDAVVGPGPEVVLPDGALRVALQQQTFDKDWGARTWRVVTDDASLQPSSQMEGQKIICCTDAYVAPGDVNDFLTMLMT